MAERRKSERHPAAVRVRLQYPNVETFIEKFSINVSRGGIFIRTREPREQGDLVRFEFQLHDGTPVFRGEGQVVWVKPWDAENPSKPHGMGLKYTRLDRRSRDLIDRILRHKAREQAPGAGGEDAVEPGAGLEASSSSEPEEDVAPDAPDEAAVASEEAAPGGGGAPAERCGDGAAAAEATEDAEPLPEPGVPAEQTGDEAHEAGATGDEPADPNAEEPLFEAASPGGGLEGEQVGGPSQGIDPDAVASAVRGFVPAESSVEALLDQALDIGQVLVRVTAGRPVDLAAVEAELEELAPEGFDPEHAIARFRGWDGAAARPGPIRGGDEGGVGQRPQIVETTPGVEPAPIGRHEEAPEPVEAALAAEPPDSAALEAPRQALPATEEAAEPPGGGAEPLGDEARHQVEAVVAGEGELDAEPPTEDQQLPFDVREELAEADLEPLQVQGQASVDGPAFGGGPSSPAVDETGYSVEDEELDELGPLDTAMDDLVEGEPVADGDGLFADGEISDLLDGLLEEDERTLAGEGVSSDEAGSPDPYSRSRRERVELAPDILEPRPAFGLESQEDRAEEFEAAREVSDDAGYYRGEPIVQSVEVSLDTVGTEAVDVLMEPELEAELDSGMSYSEQGGLEPGHWEGDDEHVDEDASFDDGGATVVGAFDLSMQPSGLPEAGPEWPRRSEADEALDDLMADLTDAAEPIDEPEGPGTFVLEEEDEGHREQVLDSRNVEMLQDAALEAAPPPSPEVSGPEGDPQVEAAGAGRGATMMGVPLREPSWPPPPGDATLPSRPPNVGPLGSWYGEQDPSGGPAVEPDPATAEDGELGPSEGDDHAPKRKGFFRKLFGGGEG